MSRPPFEAPRLALDRAPVLQGVFERLAGMCGEGVRGLLPPQCTFMLNGLVSGTTWDLIESYEDGFGSVYYSPEWDTRILIGCDRRFVFSFVEAMFGGDGTEPGFENSRAFSSIESRAIKEIINVAANALQTLLTPIERTSLSFERAEAKLDFSTLGLPDAPAIMAQLVAQVFDGGGRLFVLIPQSALAPFRKRLEQQRPPEQPHHDPQWARQLLAEVGRADVRLDAVLPGPELSLAQVAGLRVGHLMKLKISTDGLLDLVSGEKTLFRCKLGQSRGRFTVRIEAEASENAEMAADPLDLPLSVRGADDTYKVAS